MLSKRKKHFREKGSFGKHTIGRTTTLSLGGVFFFSRGALKKFLFCLYLLSAVRRWWCVGVLFRKKKRPTKDFASLALLVVVFWSPFSISLLVVADVTHDPPDETLVWSSRPQESTTTSLAQRKSLYVFRR